MTPFVKHDPDAPPRFFAAEAAGLRWLADAAASHGGVPAVVPVSVAADRIVLPRLDRAPATPAAAERFGRELAATHRSGAAHHGSPPPGLDGDGFIGPLPLPHASGDRPRPAAWGAFYAVHRLRPYAEAARAAGSLSHAAADVVERLCARLESGDAAVTGPVEPASRLHGDLWSGNVLWTASGAVLIDPAAHGGHRETDLAMLALFGLPHLDRALAAYAEAWPLADGWRDRVGLHQLHPLLVHAVLFGGGYGAQAEAVARRYV